MNSRKGKISAKNDKNQQQKVKYEKLDDASDTFSKETTTEKAIDTIDEEEKNYEVSEVENTNGDSSVGDKMETPESVDKNIVDDLGIHCVICNITSCLMWRKYDRDKLICNMCHLKRIKNAKIENGTITVKTNSSNNKNKEIQTVRISSRKNKAKKKLPSIFYSERIIKNGNIKNRRNMFKKKPLKGVDGGASIVVTLSVYHNGLLYQVGDIVCTCDLDGLTYFAQIRGFLQDSFCEKFVVVTWLVPTRPNQHTFDPLLFLPGLDEDSPRPMECFDFVCRAPTDFFKSRRLHPPLLHSQANLENLIVAAETLRGNQRKPKGDPDKEHKDNSDTNICSNSDT